jgi:hypothetical protein
VVPARVLFCVLADLQLSVLRKSHTHPVSSVLFGPSPQVMDIGKHRHETFQFYYWDPPKQFHDFACSNNMARVCGAAVKASLAGWDTHAHSTAGTYEALKPLSVALLGKDDEKIKLLCCRPLHERRRRRRRSQARAAQASIMTTKVGDDETGRIIY